MGVKTVGARVRKLRKNKGWSQKRLAEELGYCYHAEVSRWETGNRLPTATALHELADLFGVTVEFLLSGDPTVKEHKPKNTGDKFHINGRPTERCSVLIYPRTHARVKQIAKRHGISAAEALDQIVAYAIASLED